MVSGIPFYWAADVHGVCLGPYLVSTSNLAAAYAG